jgi:hypothetical protein
MHRSMMIIALGLAACGSKSNPQPTMVGNNTDGEHAASSAIPAGSYLCRFEEGGYKYDPYPCNVTGGGASAQIEKVGGFERFKGTLSASGHDLALDATAGCDDGSTACNIHFKGTLTFVDNGLWSGSIKADGAGPDGPWWLDGGTLDLEYLPPGSDPMGGQLYAGYSSDEMGD